MVSDEKIKFQVADQDHDDRLVLDEYAAFLHPHNYDFMHKYEIERTLAEYDNNQDGLISFTEYLRECKKMLLFL
jgi:Ca2+-binding EF-hand superfamily protein